MRITNRYGAPQPLVNALAKDDYTRGQAHKSITQLINPPQIDLLKEQYGETIDVSDGLWLLMGRVLHHVCQMGADDMHIAEERLFARIRGWSISGAMDLQHMDNGGVVIVDYKLTSVWSALSAKPEWTAQLNSYGFLARMAKGYRIERLEVCALLRDWRQADRDKKKNYPPSPILMVPIQLWSFAEQQRYLEERVVLHQEAWRRQEWGEPLPECTPEERWERKGVSIRCARYCPVSDRCEQFRRIKNG